jgi:hypothetical protein
MGPPADDHDCGWKTRAADLEAKLEEVAAKMAAMERRILGPKSEKLPPMDREVRKQRPADPAATRATRRKNAELRATPRRHRRRSAQGAGGGAHVPQVRRH